MAGMWRKAMLYLGLGPDEEYDDYEPRAAATSRPARPAPVREPEVEAVGTVRPITRSGAVREREAPVREVPVRETEVPAVTVRPRTGSSVRTVPGGASAKPHTVEPRSFNEAQEVADRFKEGQPVIVNLQNVDRDLSRRLIDFSSGLCYGLGGTMEKVAGGVYLLTPANVEVSAEERRRITDPDESTR